jgi:hypothetical protein
LRYQISKINPPRGYDLPDPDILSAVQTLLSSEGTWFFIKGFDEDLAEAIEDACDEVTSFEMYAENEDGAWVRYLVHPQVRPEPVSDD